MAHYNEIKAWAGKQPEAQGAVRPLQWANTEACRLHITHTHAAAVSYNEILCERVNFPLDREQAGREAGREGWSGAAGQEEEAQREGNIYCYYTEQESKNTI